MEEIKKSYLQSQHGWEENDMKLPEEVNLNVS